MTADVIWSHTHQNINRCFLRQNATNHQVSESPDIEKQAREAVATGISSVEREFI
jgi:hypothetical protein